MGKAPDAARRHLVQLLGGSVLLASHVARAQTNPTGNSVTLSGFRMVQQDNVRLHFDLSAQTPDATLFTLTNPERLVIDLPNARMAENIEAQQFTQGAVKGFRFGQHEENKLRVVIDLHRPVSPTFQFVPRQNGQRLIVDLGVKGNPALADYKARITEQAELRDVIVAIDAGHGGKDPGAVGQRATREKDITLQVSRRLFNRLQKQPGITPVMIRNKDTYVALRERIRIARSKNADLFVSVHADAFKRKAAKGSSVYALSLKGASSEAAAWLAEKENEVDDLFGDVALDGLSQDVKQTLLDLAQNTTLEASMEVGTDVLGQLKKVGAVHKPSVEQANFAVLKSPDIPSVLVETAFISNLAEERKLKSPRFQENLALAIQKGVTEYLTRRAPVGTVLHHNKG